MSSTDTYLVEKLKEILARLHLPVSPTQFPSYVKSSSSSLADGRPRFEQVDDIKTLYGINSQAAAVESDSDVILKRNLNEFIQALKSSLSTAAASLASNSVVVPKMSPESESSSSSEYEFNLTDDDINHLNQLMSPEETGSVALKHVVIIVFYICIACIAIIGNLLVVELVVRSRRFHTLTHALLANLAVADLFMAGLNIPFSISRVILIEWPFGSFLCQMIPFVQVTSVYVTSITMASIALDRYQVIMNPLGRRMKSSEGALLVVIIWVLSGLLSLPFALHHKVVTILTVRIVKRCQADFESIQARQWLTIGTFFAQYLIPLLITSVSYVSIMHRLGQRSSGLGSTTPRQVEAQSRGKRTTIKMLVLTVIFFAICWAPINTYHILTHFTLVRHNSTAILICHLIAMSSTCYNPFIYCWLNEHFRLEALKWLKCFRTKRSPTVHPGIEVNGILTRSDFYRRNQSTATMGGTMSFRSQAVGNNSASTINTQPASSSLICGSLGSSGPPKIGGGSRNFMSRIPRGVFPPELLFLTRPSISQQLEETTENDEEDEDVESSASEAEQRLGLRIAPTDLTMRDDLDEGSIRLENIIGHSLESVEQQNSRILSPST